MPLSVFPSQGVAITRSVASTVVVPLPDRDAEKISKMLVQKDSRKIY